MKKYFHAYTSLKSYVYAIKKIICNYTQIYYMYGDVHASATPPFVWKTPLFHGKVRKCKEKFTNF